MVFGKPLERSRAHRLYRDAYAVSNLYWLNKTMVRVAHDKVILLIHGIQNL